MQESTEAECCNSKCKSHSKRRRLSKATVSRKYLTTEKEWDKTIVCSKRFVDESCDKARRKLVQPEYASELGTTDGETDNEAYSRRERNVHPPAQYNGYTSDESDSQSDMSAGGSSRSCPVDLSLDSDNGLAEVTPSPRICSSAVRADHNMRAKNRRSHKEKRPRHERNKPGHKTSNHYRDPMLKDMVQSQLRLERQNSKLFEILERQRFDILELKNMMARQVCYNTAAEPALEPLPEGLEFPLETVGQIETLETHLVDSAVFNTVLHKLKVVGGATVKETSVNLMRHIFARGPAEQYCWRGSTEGRKSFSSLRLKEVLFMAVRKNPPTCEGTNAEIKKVVQEWFRTAVDRNGGRKRRSNGVPPSIHPLSPP